MANMLRVQRQRAKVDTRKWYLSKVLPKPCMATRWLSSPVALLSLPTAIARARKHKDAAE